MTNLEPKKLSAERLAIIASQVDASEYSTDILALLAHIARLEQKLAEEINERHIWEDSCLKHKEMRFAAEQEAGRLGKALEKMIGWAKYAEDCDPFYFMPEQAPEWQHELAEAEAALSKHKESK